MHYIYIYLLGIVFVIIELLLLFFYIRFKKKSNQNSLNPSQISEQDYSFIFKSINEGIIVIDKNLNISLFNPAAESITGWQLNDVLKMNIKLMIKLLDDKNKPVSDQDNPFIKVFNTKQNVRNTNLQIVNKDTSTISVSINAFPIKQNDQVTSAIILLRDIDEEKKEEEQLVDFISTASHEMRTPVAAIEGYLSLAMNTKISNIDNNVRDYLQKAYMATSHLGQLFQDLLTSAKAEDGRLTNHPQVIEMGSFLKQLTEDLKFSAQKKGLKIELVIGSEEKIKNEIVNEKNILPFYYVYADPDRLREVITNLFDNAVKFTPEGGITIGITADQNIVQIFVRDTGIGIPSEDINHLFQKFYRIDNTATRTIGGTGLGLFIAKKILELYNGKIWVESELKKGSTFYINLPKLNDSQVEELNHKITDLNNGVG
ncbi:MAG: PAS domain-containing sensor histidine kinase [Patescibacteria group bacterium]|jgi:PAS domain S-box-containing protein|nr:PAS domain-containing sensor histidine kinase [Patescibacteria group bacterium]